MKFKEYLNEFTKHKLSHLIALRAIPLSEPMMDRLGYLWTDTVACSVLNMNTLKQTAKNQNKKMHISTFTKAGPELARLPSQPNIVIKLNGTEVIRGESDIWSLVDTQNRRWLDIDVKAKHGKTLYLFLNGILQKVLEQNGLDYVLSKDKPFGGDKNLEVELNKLPSKTKSTIYKDYIESVERFLNSSGYKYLNLYLKNLDQFEYNEVILSNWKITEVKAIQQESPALLKLCKELNLNYTGVIQRKDLAKLKC
jgi:hypothetical protein